jgi:chromosome segregation ATPase
MREAIDTVPRNGDFVILEDDGLAKYAIARWSSETSQWVDEGGTPCTINPTHWHPFGFPGYVPEPTDELGSAAAKAGPAAMRAYHAAKGHDRARGPSRPRKRRTPAVRARLGALGTRLRESLSSWRATLTTGQRQYRVPAIVAGVIVVAAAGAWSYQSEIAGFSDRFMVSATAELAQARQALREEEEKVSKLVASLVEARHEEEGQQRSAEGAQYGAEEADRLRDELAAAKREIELRTASAQAAGDEVAKAKEASDRSLDELRQALQNERDKAGKLVDDLAAATREVEARTASLGATNEEAAKAKETAARTADELRQTLQAERDRAEGLVGDLAASNREIEARTASLRIAGEEAAKARETATRTADDLRQALQAERDKAGKLVGDLAAANREIEARTASLSAANEEAAKAKETATRTADELRQALRAERDKAEKLAGDLSAARRGIETQMASVRTASDEAAKVTEANVRTADDLGRALRDERDNVEKLRGELEALVRDRDAQTAAARAAGNEAARLREASTRAVDDGRQALQAERRKTDKLAGELDRAKSELDTLAKAKTSDEAALQARLAELRQSLQREAAATAAAREAADAERLRRQRLEQQHASRPAGQSELRSASAEGAASTAGQTKPAAATRPAAAPLRADAETVRLLARASLLLEQGDIAASRSMLDRAAETGSPEAIFALAETYDPVVLAARQTFGTQGDAAKAREFYTKALAGGMGEARARLDALKQ